MSSTAFTLRAHDGFRLSALRWGDSQTPRAVLLIVHGAAEHAARYEGFANACVDAGLVVYAYDQRGHGASVSDDTPRGHLGDEGGFANAVKDVGTARAHIASTHGQAPLFILGHSMGSVVLRTYLLDHANGVSGAIISATSPSLPGIGLLLRTIARWDAKKGRRTPSTRMNKLVFGGFNARVAAPRTPYDWLTRDAALVDAYCADPHCGFLLSAQLWADILNAGQTLDTRETDKKQVPVKLPLLLIAGTADPSSLGGRAHGQLAKRYRRAGNQDVTDQRYPQGRHEMLNETNRAQVFSDILAWVERVSPGF